VATRDAVVAFGWMSIGGGGGDVGMRDSGMGVRRLASRKSVCGLNAL